MFRTHGLAIREGKSSRHTLYVVNHGKRESIEVFELDAKARPPALTWIGCAVAPEPVGLNSVLPLPDGGFIGTDYLERGPNAGTARGKMQAGENNGSLWEWHTGKGWKIIPGTETSGANGLELSRDGKTLFVNAWGSQSFYRMRLGQTKRDTVKLGFRADNVRWAPDGSLLVVGQGGAGQMQTTNIVKIDPTTLKVTEILTRPNTPEFGAGTVAVQVGRDLWVGSFRGAWCKRQRGRPVGVARLGHRAARRQRDQHRNLEQPLNWGQRSNSNDAVMFHLANPPVHDIAPMNETKIEVHLMMTILLTYCGVIVMRHVQFGCFASFKT